jgi:hypothetical protein
MTAFGVAVRRLSAWRMTGTVGLPKLDNVVVEMVNEVVDRVN